MLELSETQYLKREQMSPAFIKRNTPVAFIVVKTAWDAASESSSRRHLGSMTITTRTLCARDVIVQVSYFIVRMLLKGAITST